jgi:hypothetical protein
MADPQARAEASLDRYVEPPSPFRDFLAEAVRQAPWWAISLLVHVFALLIFWNWPITDAARIEEAPSGIVVKLPKEEPRETVEVVQPPPPIPPPIETPTQPWDPGEMNAKTGEPGAPGDPKTPDPVVPPLKLQEPREKWGAPVIALPADGPLPPVTDGSFIGRDRIRTIIDKGRYRPGPGGKVGKDPGPAPVQAEALWNGLRWLAHAQERDGSWDAKKWGGGSSYRVGMVGLALLAYEGAGFTHLKGSFQANIGKALDWLRDHQQADGSFPFETFYEQGIATMAVCEAFGLTKDPHVRRMAQHAISYICKVQPEHGGFRYGGPVPKDEGDMSVTGWQIMAIKSAILAELEVPTEAVERSRTFLKNSWREYGASAYLVGDKAAGSLAVTAIGMLCREFLNDNGQYSEEIRQTADYLYNKEAQGGQDLPGGGSKQLLNDIYYTYYSSLAMFQTGGSRSEYWRAWRVMYLKPLIEMQVQEERDAAGRFVKGSWDPAKHRWGDRGGRVYATALAILCLEAPYRFLPSSRLGS